MMKPSSEVLDMFLFTEGSDGPRLILQKLQNWPVDPIRREDSISLNTFDVILDRDANSAHISSGIDTEMNCDIGISDLEAKLIEYVWPTKVDGRS